jgi:desulfoferrodoxin (superoxide reductase-like protein)
MKTKQKLLLGIALFTIASLFSHPAKAVKLTFDPTMTILQVTIEHGVKNPDDHFINSVTVMLNKKEIITQSFSRQENAKETTVMYKLFDAKAGDEIEVITTCVKSGTKKEKITVPAPPTRPPMEQNIPKK